MPLLSKDALYVHFKNKEAVFLGVFDDLNVHVRHPESRARFKEIYHTSRKRLAETVQRETNACSEMSIR